MPFLAAVLLLVWLLWLTWPRPVSSSAAGQDAAHVLVGAGGPARDLRWIWGDPAAAPRRVRFPGRPALTEDDLIAFGLALERSDDGVAELLDGQSSAQG
jgi:hypothetical protein